MRRTSLRRNFQLSIGQTFRPRISVRFEGTSVLIDSTYLQALDCFKVDDE